MGKGMIPKKGYNDKLYHNNYDGIAWPSKKKERKKCYMIWNQKIKHSLKNYYYE
jgi:hypothetical protein